jgi:GNAT superfamily N-acetyltransferase
MLQIRNAGPEDVGLILSFVRKLAEYEKLTHQVQATEEMLGETMFGARRVAECVFAEWDGEAVGFALFFHNYSTFLGRPGIYLEDLFVDPPHRGQGIGKALLAHVARVAVERGCGRLDWSVLDWNEPSIGFYKSLGARPLAEWTTYRMTGEALGKLAEVSRG